MKVVVCGAGIAGLTLANRMSVLGGEVVLLERAPGPRPQGYMIDFFGPGYDAAEAMGLLPAIEDVAYHIEEASLVDERGRRRAGLRPAQFSDGPLLDIMRPDLERVLRNRLPEEVDLRFGTGPVAVADRGDRVLVTLDDGVELDADLLVGADGIHSTVRRLVFGQESRFLRYLGFHTAAFSFEAPEISAAVAGRACLTDTVDRQMGFYALRGGRVAAFAVHRTPDPVLPHDLRAAVRDTYAGLGWVVPEVLDRCPPSAEIYYDQVAQVELPRWSTGRVVLVGDAAHAVSLLAGQGASLGIAGAYLLADQLAQAQSISEALVNYETLWRPVAEEKQKTGRGAARWFLPKSAWQLRMRRAALRMARVPVIDRLVAARLAGKSVAFTLRSAATPADRSRSHTLADGRRLAYAEWGDPDGYPVFYLHGTPGSRLEGALPDHAARARHIRLVAVDRPGYGRSTFQPNRTFRDWPNDVTSLADELGITRFGVVGHSGAGPHLFACGALLPPERLRFVGALGPWGPIATPEIMAGLNRLDRLYARLARHTPWIMRASFAPLGWCARHWPNLFLALLMAAVSPADKAALRTGDLRERLRESELEAFRQGSRGAAHEALIAYRDWEIDLATVRVPTHIWLGDEDIFVSRQMGRYLEHTIPGVDFHWIPGAGHFDVTRWDDILTVCATHL